MYGKKSFYNLGAIEYLRNDSFSIAAYNEDRFLNVSRISPVLGSSAVLPGKSVIDSFFRQNQDNYTATFSTITIEEQTYKQLRLIKTQAAGDSVLYDSLRVIYNANTYSLHSIEYAFKQPVDEEVGGEPPAAKPGLPETSDWAVKFKIAFFDYEAGDTSSNTFSTSRLINEDEPGKWIGAGKYAGYTIYWSDDKGTQTIIN